MPPDAGLLRDAARTQASTSRARVPGTSAITRSCSIRLESPARPG